MIAYITLCYSVGPEDDAYLVIDDILESLHEIGIEGRIDLIEKRSDIDCVWES